MSWVLMWNLLNVNGCGMNIKDFSTIRTQQIQYHLLGALCVMASTPHEWCLYNASISEGHESRLYPEDRDSKGI
jgi:hypothetical protein